MKVKNFCKNCHDVISGTPYDVKTDTFIAGGAYCSDLCGGAHHQYSSTFSFADEFKKEREKLKLSIKATKDCSFSNFKFVFEWMVRNDKCNPHPVVVSAIRDSNTEVCAESICDLNDVGAEFRQLKRAFTSLRRDARAGYQNKLDSEWLFILRIFDGSISSMSCISSFSGETERKASILKATLNKLNP